MTPSEFERYIETLVAEGLWRQSAMFWGPPGIGKSSIVAQVASRNQLQLVDIRLGQLSPQDLRGLPVAEAGTARWYPPEFLPQDGTGILFLDEMNMAPPTMQGIAQQLIHDRRVGSYEVPGGWYVWAAGNRKEDRASVFEMPAPVANRFIHLSVDPDYDSFRDYAARRRLHERIQAFLAFRPSLLFKMAKGQVAFPSPRSWEKASELHAAGLDIAPAVGEGVAGEFTSFLTTYDRLPDLDQILRGDGEDLRFPEEPSIRYAFAVGLSSRADDAPQAIRAMKWILSRAGDEFAQLFFQNAAALLRERGQFGQFMTRLDGEDEIAKFVSDMSMLEV